MLRVAIVVAVLAAACSVDSKYMPVGGDPGETGSGAGTGSGSGSGAGSGVARLPDVRCTGAPDAGPPGDFHHLASSLIAKAGDPRHRGLDLIAPASAASQLIEGWISYTLLDKALEDEDVDLFACRNDQWQKLGTARTDGEGHFAFPLAGADRLPIGVRDLYVSVVGDRTGTSFVAFVAPDGTPIAVSDVDGTLTSSENAFPTSLVTGRDPDAQPHAADAFTAAAHDGIYLVYVTARGNQYTSATRGWLADHAFPRGPLRLATSFITLPGADTVAYKTSTIEALAQGFALVAGVGNRDSDVTAYTSAGIAADHIFIKLPEFQSEVQADLDAQKAVGITDYAQLTL